MTVLLAERDPLLRQALRCALGRAGFEVVDAVASPEALCPPDAAVDPAIDPAIDPAVLVADARPSARHETEAAHLGLVLEAKRRWPRLGIVLISGCGADPDELAVADRFLPKPFSGRALIQAVKEAAQALEPGRRPARPACAPPAQGQVA